MKNLLYLIILICYSSWGQIIYSDNFDENINSFSSSTNIATFINDNTIEIVGHGNAEAWENITYTFHSSGNNLILDASANPKLYLKIKSDIIPSMRIDLIDSNGYITNLDESIIYPLAEYQIVEIDYTNKLIDGGYGGPCSPGPCDVDSSKLESLVVYFNPGIGMYHGTTNIDWISIGEPLEPLYDYEIRYNQIGYFVGKEKVIKIVSKNNFSSKSYTVLNSNNDIVLSSTTTSPILWGASNEYIAQADISSLNSSGNYKFKIDDLEKIITIGNNVYEDISKATLKYYYFNRASTAIETEYGGIHSRNAGHLDDIVKIHYSAESTSFPTGTIISSSKGWYDAGDYNKYIVNSGISTYTLLSAFEHYKSYYQTLNTNIPESNNNLPDILDEIKWNLDWMLTMQNPNDGSVYHKLTGLNFSGEVLPENYALDRYVVGKSTAAALNFAAVMAKASKVFSEYTNLFPNYSSQLLTAAEAAYLWAKENPTEYFLNPNDVTTGQYDDTNVTDEFQWAAVELFISTSNLSYKNDIDLSSINGGAPTWAYSSPLALISILYQEDFFANYFNLDETKNRLVNTAINYKNYLENNQVPTTLNNQDDYLWGSNSRAAHHMVILIRAYEITKDNSFLRAAYKAMDYILGNNGTGYSYVTGFGIKQVLHPHHRTSRSDNITAPVPGMLAGGPNQGIQDFSEGLCQYPDTENASSYIDNWCSYASNEVAINWNAPLTYALNALQFYQNEGTLGVEDPLINSHQLLSIFPNPTKDFINVKTSDDIKSINLYNARGQLISIYIKSHIDLSEYPKGMYFIKIITEKNKTYVKKIIRN